MRKIGMMTAVNSDHSPENWTEFSHIKQKDPGKRQGLLNFLRD